MLDGSQGDLRFAAPRQVATYDLDLPRLLGVLLDRPVESKTNQLACRLQAELFLHMSSVGFHRFRTDIELLRNIFRAPGASQKFQDFEFPGREPVDKGAFRS